MPKSEFEARLITDFSKITPFLPCPRFYLPIVFKLLQALDFENKYLCKLDLKDAFFHINIHPDSQYVTTFRFLGKYYKYTCLPFGLSVAPFYMQMFANCISQRFRTLGMTAWGHIDDFVISHKDPDQLRHTMKDVLRDLVLCGVRVNWKKTVAEPTRKLQVLGAIFDTVRNEATLSEDRKALILHLFEILHKADVLRLVTWQRILGHLAYVWPFIGAPWFLLKPLYAAEDDGRVPHDAVRRAHLAWMENLKSISLRLVWDQPTVVYVDATPFQLGLVCNNDYIAVPLHGTLPIYVSELLAIIYSMFYALLHGIDQLHVYSDNIGAIGTSRRLRGYFTPPLYMDILYRLKSIFCRFTISYVNTLANPADYPSRTDLL